MKIKVMMAMPKQIARGYAMIVDTDDHPKLKALIDNGELPDLSRGGEVTSEDAHWGSEVLALDIYDFVSKAIGENEDWYEHFEMVEGHNGDGIVWENDEEPKEMLGFVPQD